MQPAQQSGAFLWKPKSSSIRCHREYVTILLCTLTDPVTTPILRFPKRSKRQSLEPNSVSPQGPESSFFIDIYFSLVNIKHSLTSCIRFKAEIKDTCPWTTGQTAKWTGIKMMLSPLSSPGLVAGAQLSPERLMEGVLGLVWEWLKRKLGRGQDSGGWLAGREPPNPSSNWDSQAGPQWAAQNTSSENRVTILFARSGVGLRR